MRGLGIHVTEWPGRDPEPLVLLHGWADCSDTFQFLVDALDERHTCIAPDLRGFGRSDWNTDGYWFPDYVGDLDQLLEQVAPEAPVTLIGHSMGGNIAMLYAGVRPERVRRVVCIEGFGLPRTQPAQAPGRYREWLEQLRTPPVFATFPTMESLAHLLARRNPRLLPERAAFIAAAWGRVTDEGKVEMRADPAHKRVNAVLYRREEAEACWREIAAPVLYVVANQSEALTRMPEDADPDAMARIVRRLEPCRIDDATHMVHHERPEVLAAHIEDFLART